MGLFGKKKEEVEEPETEESEEVDEKNNYERTITCGNCDEETTIEIPCGTKVKDFIRGKKCEYCECILQED